MGHSRPRSWDRGRLARLVATSFKSSKEVSPQSMRAGRPRSQRPDFLPSDGLSDLSGAGAQTPFNVSSFTQGLKTPTNPLFSVTY